MKYEFRIGIIGWSTGENSFGVTKPYLRHIGDYGTPVILTPHETPDTTLDMVVMPGGKDTSSWFVDKRPSFYNSDADQFKEYFLHKTLKNYIDAGIPIWGTCLGMQQLCAYFGATITQDLNGHPTTNPEKRWEPAHTLIINPEFKELEDTVMGIMNEGKKTKSKKEKLEVNSLHHQGIMLDQIGETLDVIAYSPDDVVEVIKHPTLPIAGAQCHVEEDWNLLCNCLFQITLQKSPRFEAHKKKNKNEEVNS